MTFTKGHKVLLLIAVGVIVIAAIIFLFVVSTRQPQVEPPIGDDQVTGTDQPVERNQALFTPPAMSEIEKTQKTLQNSALMFAERFGSFSETTNGLHVSEIETLMTDTFYDWASTTYVKELKQSFGPGRQYTGVSTDALSVEFVELLDSRSEVIVTTKRTKKKNGNEPLIFNETLTITYVNQDGEWLVDAAYWEQQ